MTKPLPTTARSSWGGSQGLTMSANLEMVHTMARKIQLPRLSALQIVALSVGTAWLGQQTWLMLEHSSGMSPAQLASVPLATVSLALLPVLGEVALKNKQRGMAAGLAALFVLLLGYSLPSAITRSAEGRDKAMAEASAFDSRKAQLEGTLATARKAVDDVKAEVKRECKSGNGSKCKGWREDQQSAEKRVEQVEGQLLALGAAPVVNSDAKRLATILHVSEATVALYQPLALPLANEMAVWLLIWMGISPSLMVKPVAKRRKRTAPKAKQVDNVVQLAVAK